MNRHAMPRLVSLILALLLPLAACDSAPSPTPQKPPLAGADIGGDFELVDKTGKTVRWSKFDGKYRIVYFGYTFCPDVCPNDVGKLIRGLNMLKESEPAKAARIQPIFITIDPARDTPEIVGEFAAAFSDDLVGLTGSAEQIAAAADAFRVYYAKGEQTGDSYLMEHSAIAYLFGPAGEPIATLPTDQGPAAITAELDKWVD